MPHCNGHISFSNVTFAYNAQRPALRDISFEVPQGTSTAIVGESGSGKSTLLKLLFRFYEVDEGAIRIDNRDVRQFFIESLREHIGVVPQDTILFNDTLMYNLLYARPDATEAEVYEACRSASIHNKILSFPNGYYTSVGERGLKLSGGERQRVREYLAFSRREACGIKLTPSLLRSPSPELSCVPRAFFYLTKLLLRLIRRRKDRFRMRWTK